MRSLAPVLALLLAACAGRVTTRTSDQLAESPRYCGDAVYKVEQVGVPDAVAETAALAEIALTEPGAYRCNSQTADRNTPQHYQDTRELPGR